MIERNVKVYWSSKSRKLRSIVYFFSFVLQTFNSFAIVFNNFSLDIEAVESMKEHWSLRVSKFFDAEIRVFLGFFNFSIGRWIFERKKSSVSCWSTNVRCLANSYWVFGYSDASAFMVCFLIIFNTFQL